MMDLQPLLDDIVAEQQRVIDELDTADAKRGAMAALDAQNGRRRAALGVAAALLLSIAFFAYHRHDPDENPALAADGVVPAATSAAEPAAVIDPPDPTPVDRPRPEPPPVRAVPATGTAPRGAARPRTWHELLEAGSTKEALDAAEGTGAAAAASPDQLLRLAEAALVAKRPSLARWALEALRKDHADSNQAAIASFYLGKLAMKGGKGSDAIAAFEAYLAEQPNGDLARDARGRLIEALEMRGRSAEARAAARDYLKHHPRGPHAPLARRVLESGR